MSEEQKDFSQDKELEIPSFAINYPDLNEEPASSGADEEQKGGFNMTTEIKIVSQEKDSNEDNTCAPCNPKVKFCCVTTINSEFPIIEDTNLPYENLRLVFTTACLKCIVEECNVNCVPPPGCNDTWLTATKYQIKIFGCIKYLFSAFVDFTNVPGAEKICGFKRAPSNAAFNTVTEDKKVSVCCQGCVCVDNAICIKNTLAEAQQVCDALNPITCDDITLKELKVITHPVGTQFELCSNNHVLRFEAEIELPSC